MGDRYWNQGIPRAWPLTPLTTPNSLQTQVRDTKLRSIIMYDLAKNDLAKHFRFKMKIAI